MAIDWQSFLQNGFNVANNPTLTGFPRGAEQLGGAAALIASLRDQPTLTIPDYASFATPQGTAAKGFLQKSFETPDDPFKSGGIYESYLPLIQREEGALLDQLGNEFSRAFPAGSGMQGSAVSATRRLGEDFLNNRYKLIADLTRENQTRKLQSAQSLAGFENAGQAYGFQANLSAAQQAYEAERERQNRLAQLGLTLIMDQGGGPTQTVNIGGQPPGGIGPATGMGSTPGMPGGSRINPLASATGLPLQLGQLNPFELAQQLAFGGDGASLQGALGLIAGGAAMNPASGAAFTQAVSQMLGGAQIGAFEQVGNGAVAILDQSGQIIGGVLPNGQVVSGTTGQVVGDLGVGGASSGAAPTAAGFQGLLGPAGTGSAAALTSAAISAVGSGYLGYHVGSKVGDWLENPGASSDFQTGGAGAVGGAATGAAFGAAIGDGPGAVIGAIVGGLAGAFGGAGAENRREDAQRQQEEQATLAARPEAIQTVQEYFSASSNANQTLMSQAPAMVARMRQLSNDPGLVNILNQFKSTPVEGAPPFPADHEPTAVMSWISGILREGAQYFNPSDRNPEGYAALLQSPESGKFFNATQALKNSLSRFQTVAPLTEQLMTYLGV